jgi:hypothetical protein
VLAHLHRGSVEACMVQGEGRCVCVCVCRVRSLESAVLQPSTQGGTSDTPAQHVVARCIAGHTHSTFTRSPLTHACTSVRRPLTLAHKHTLHTAPRSSHACALPGMGPTAAPPPPGRLVSHSHTHTATSARHRRCCWCCPGLRLPRGAPPCCRPAAAAQQRTIPPCCRCRCCCCWRAPLLAPSTPRA